MPDESATACPGKPSCQRTPIASRPLIGPEEHAGEEVLHADHLVIVRPDIGAEKPVVRVLVMTVRVCDIHVRR